MLEINLKAEITNINYLRYMEAKDSGDGAENLNLERERASTIEKDKVK